LKVLVDTSVWVDFLNGFPSAERKALAALIASDHEICTCGVVVAEVFQGLRQEKGRARLGELFKELAFLEPTGIDLYFRAADVYRRLREKGHTVRSTIDCLIAVLAEESGSSVLARDRDLSTILASGLVAVRSWPIGGKM
jgi:predicted nucleic acid-binding protein